MYVSPQRRAFFRQENSKKCFGADVFCTCSLQNVLFATAACNFWFLLWPHDSAPAALTGLLFDWPDTRINEKTQHFATSLTFGADVSSFFWLSRYCIFFLLTWLLYSAFQLSILSEVCYLNFLRLPNMPYDCDQIDAMDQVRTRLCMMLFKSWRLSWMMFRSIEFAMAPQPY